MRKRRKGTPKPRPALIKLPIDDPESPQFQALRYTSFGATAKAAAKKTKLSEGQVRYAIWLTDGKVSAKHWREMTLPDHERTLREMDRSLARSERILREIKAMANVASRRAKAAGHRQR